MNHIATLSHSELRALYKAGKISVRANMSMSMHICDRDPRISTATRAAHHFFKWLGLLMFAGGPVSMFFIRWYWGLAIFFLSFMVFSGLRQSAGQFVVETALENEGFYRDMLAMNVLSITEE